MYVYAQGCCGSETHLGIRIAVQGLVMGLVRRRIVTAASLPPWVTLEEFFHPEGQLSGDFCGYDLDPARKRYQLFLLVSRRICISYVSLFG